jgi:5-methylcytosine-specific restriction endonuclease McrBC GTP-binding regulatory subunit McrB
MKHLGYFMSIKTKPFIILAGLSGTGKSRLARTFAYQFNNIETDRSSQKHPPSNFHLLKVKPNWHDSSELLGYESRISGKDRFIVTDFIRFIVKAWQNLNTPFFLCLDEMNLAPIEQYFAEYLSVIETRRIDKMGRVKTDPLIGQSLINKYAKKDGRS